MAIKLLNIYTHQYGSTGIEKSCTVYNNGIMRLAIWAEIQYQDVSESDAISDVQKNLTIYHGQAGDMSVWTHMGVRQARMVMTWRLQSKKKYYHLKITTRHTVPPEHQFILQSLPLQRQQACWRHMVV